VTCHPRDNDRNAGEDAGCPSGPDVNAEQEHQRGDDELATGNTEQTTQATDQDASDQRCWNTDAQIIW
jgi:hypothetical protein